jgi:membrane protein DedA with SNARE-associated domain
MAAQGKLSHVYVVIAGVMGSTAGALPWYYAGRYVTPDFL